MSPLQSFLRWQTPYNRSFRKWNTVYWNWFVYWTL